MGKRKQGGHDVSQKVPNQWWCYYCDTRHEDEFKLIQHQRSKHFLCRLCDPKAYGRNCLSLSGLVSHVRRSHRTELKEVPGAIEGRTSLQVEVTAMNGIPQEALDEFNETLAEEMMAAGHDLAPARRASVQEHDDDDALPPLPRDDIEEPPLEKLRPAKPGLMSPTPSLKPNIVANLIMEHAKSKKQQQQPPPEPQPDEAEVKNKEVQAFDPSLLAERLAGVNVPAPEPVVDREAEKAANKAKEKEDEEERARKEEEGRRKREMFAALAKDEKQEEVVRVDKNVVQDLGSAFAARAAAAAAAEAKNRAAMPKPSKGAPVDITSLRTRLSFMDKNALFKHAVGVGVNVDEARNAYGPPGKTDQASKDAMIECILRLEAEEGWVVCTFKPGKLGITADWISATVKQITEGGQAASNGTKVGMVFKTIDGKRYVKSLLLDKIGGKQNFDVVFATNPRPMPPIYEEEEEDYSSEEQPEEAAGPPPLAPANRAAVTSARERESPPRARERESPPRARERESPPRARERESPPPASTSRAAVSSGRESGRDRERSRSPRTQQTALKPRSSGVKEDSRRRDDYDNYYREEVREYRDEGRDYRDEGRDYRDEGRDYRDEGREVREGRRRRGRREEERYRDDDYYEEEDEWQEERYDDRRKRERQVRPRR